MTTLTHCTSTIAWCTCTEPARIFPQSVMITLTSHGSSSERFSFPSMVIHMRVSL